MWGLKKCPPPTMSKPQVFIICVLWPGSAIIYLSIFFVTDALSQVAYFVLTKQGQTDPGVTGGHGPCVNHWDLNWQLSDRRHSVPIPYQQKLILTLKSVAFHV